MRQSNKSKQKTQPTTKRSVRFGPTTIISSDQTSTSKTALSPTLFAQKTLDRLQDQIKLNRAIILNTLKDINILYKQLATESNQPFKPYGLSISISALFGNGDFIAQARKALQKRRLSAKQIDKIIKQACDKETAFFNATIEKLGRPDLFYVNGTADLPCPPPQLGINPRPN